MAIITISRQLASLGDEVSSLVAQKLGYKFLGRKEIEDRIIALGFSPEKLKRYDEKKPGFFASLTKERDEYIDYLQTAILESVCDNNCVIVGRGSFIILSNLENHLSFRFVANEKIRTERMMNQFQMNEKQAKKQLQESDNHRLGFHKSYFNYQIDDPSLYHAVINTGFLDSESAASMIAETVRQSVTPEKEQKGMAHIEELLICQRIVNLLVFEYGMNINYLRAVAHDGIVTLQGIADSSAVVDRALTLVQCELPEYKVESAINVVQDFKAYQ